MPKLVRALNLSKVIAQPATLSMCSTFACRLRGLMFRKNLTEDDGLLLVEEGETRLGAAIHMLFMRFSLAVVWLDHEGRVVDKVIARPWKAAYVPRRPATYILEMHPSRMADYEIGDQVQLVPA